MIFPLSIITVLWLFLSCQWSTEMPPLWYLNLFRMEKWWWMRCPQFQFIALNACYSKLHGHFSFEYFCFLHPLLPWFYKCLQSNYPQLYLRHIKKAVCKAQEVCSGFGLSKCWLRIIKFEVTFKSSSSSDSWFYQSLSWLSITDRMESPTLFSCCLHRSCFIPLNSLISLSILFPAFPKDPSLWALQAATQLFLSPTACFFWGSLPKSYISGV